MAEENKQTSHTLLVGNAFVEQKGATVEDAVSKVNKFHAGGQ